MSKSNQIKTSKIEKQVMGKIHSGKAHMRPQSYYLSIGALGVLAVTLLSFAAAYFMSVSMLWLRIIAADGPAYGAKRNLTNLLETFPWWALLLGIVSVVGIIYLVKKVGHMYKVRLIYLVPIVIIAFVIIGVALSFSNLPGLMNGRGSNAACQADDISCNLTGRMYGRGR